MSVSVITPVHGKKEDYASTIEGIGQDLAIQKVLHYEWIVVCDTNSIWAKELYLPHFTEILISPQTTYP